MRKEFKNLILFLKEEYPDIQAFNTRNLVGDEMTTVYEKNGIIVDFCEHWGYIEIFGLPDTEFEYLLRKGICYS